MFFDREREFRGTERMFYDKEGMFCDDMEAIQESMTNPLTEIQDIFIAIIPTDPFQIPEQ